MKYTKLGRTDLEVSRICHGTWQTGGDWGGVEEQEADDATHRALELGVNFFDTAQAYGFGASEKLLGRALQGEIARDRGSVVLATKGGLRMTDDGLVRDASPATLRAGLEDSLRFLGTDHVDLFQIHWPDHDTPAEETARACEEFVQEGKVRYVGVSNYSAEDMREFERTRKVDSNQPPYHLFRREIEEDVLPYCAEHGVGVLVYGPMAHGLLTGKFDENTQLADDDWRAGSEIFRGENFRRNVEKVNELESLAQEHGWTVAQLAVAWTLAHPAVDVAIVGVRRPDHIEGTAPAGDLELSEDDLTRIDQIMEGAVTVGGPNPEGE